MIKRAILIVTSVAVAVLLVNCGDMLNQQAAKDRDLGHMVYDNMKTSQEFQENFVNFTLVAPTKYKLVTRDLADAQVAGKYAYNAMVLLLERNDTKVKSGRSDFTIIGEQDKVQIFEVTGGAGRPPLVKLMGPFEGQTYSPQFGNQGG